MSDKLSLNASERKKQKAKKQSSTRKPLTSQQREDMLLTPCKTKEELHNWIKYHLGLFLPDVTVSRYADSNPLDAVWQIYNICVNKNNPEKVQELLYVASRGAGKTLSVAIAELMVLLHDQRDVAHVGAIMAQAKRCYDYQLGFMLNDKLKPVLNRIKDDSEMGQYRILEKMNMEKSLFNLTDRYSGESIRPTIEVIACTLKSVNGAHVSLCIGGKTSIAVDNSNNNIKNTNRNKVTITAKQLHELIQAGKEVNVLSYNHSLNQVESKPVLASFMNGKKQRLRITKESGKQLWCTPDHKIWLPSINDYVEAKDLKIGDKLLSPSKSHIKAAPQTRYDVVIPEVEISTSLTADEKVEQVLLGSILGDGGVYKRWKGSTKACFRENHGPKQVEYLKWKKEILSHKYDFREDKPSVSGYKPDSIGLRIQTFGCESLLKYTTFRKQFNLDILNKLGPMGLAVWYMDDGHKRKFCTHSFSEEQQLQLKAILKEKFDLNVELKKEYKKSKGKTYTTLMLKDVYELAKLYQIIKPFVHPSLLYKISNKFTFNCERCNKEDLTLNTTRFSKLCHDCLNKVDTSTKEVAITAIDFMKQHREVYDFTVKDNHNFFAGGVLVHNCVVDEIDTVMGEGLKAFKDISGMIDSKKGREALRVGISTRKSRYGLMNQQIENAESQGRTVKKWTAFEFAERCPDSRSGTKPTIGYYNQEDMETITVEAFEKLPQQRKNLFLKHEFPGEKCLTCPAAAICLGDSKKQMSKSPMLKPITDVLKKVLEGGADWSLSQLMNLKPSVEGIIYKEFEERIHVKDWNQMWELLTGQEYPGSCTHDAFVRKCHQMKIPAYGCVDFGWSNPSTLVVFFVDKKDTVYVVRTEAMTYVNNPSWVQMIKNKWHHMYRCQLYFPDPANPGDLVTFKQEGLPVPSKIDKDVNSGIQVVKKFLKSLASPHPKLYVSKENNEYLIKEFQTYHYKLDAAGEITDTPDKEYDHALDALRYGLYNLFGKSTFIMSELGVQYNDNIQTMDGSFIRMPSVEEFATSKGIDLKIKNPSEIPSLGQMGTAAELDELDEEDGSGTGFIWQF